MNELRNEFVEVMKDDFNTPNAITVLQKLLKEINVNLRKPQYNEEELSHLNGLYQLLNEFLNVLGLRLNIPHLTEDDIEIIRLKEEASNNKDYETADRYREQLQKKGINL